MKLNINDMLIEDSRWLVLQSTRPTKEFEKVAKEIELRQEDWTRVWNDINEKLVNLPEEEIEEKLLCQINGKDKELTKEEFEFVRFTLGDPQEESNCCGGECIHGVCQDCYEHCDLIYIFS